MLTVYSYFEKGCRKKAHATIPKGHGRMFANVATKGTKVGSTATVPGTVYLAYPILPFGIV